MTQPTDHQLAAAAQKARADHETARAIAARLLAPPDPVDILAGVIADRGDVADERDELRAERDALTADLVAIRFMVGRHEVPIVEAVRQIRDELIRERDLARADRDAARESTSEAYAIASDGLREIACALGLPADQAAIADLVAKVGDLSSSLSTAEKDAETQRTVVADLCAVLDRVAMEAGVDTEGDGFDVADRVISVLRAMQVRPVLTVERLADALRAANVTLQPTTTAFAVMAAMSHMGDPNRYQVTDYRSPTDPRRMALLRDSIVDRNLTVATEDEARDLIAQLTAWLDAPRLAARETAEASRGPIGGGS